ncbi:MAG: acyltransferase family protein [Candidatus Lokiarchaeota archaeon]|nr:acyltransferase family protein [Candidatus Lokiarchaeota archaeon]
MNYKRYNQIDVLKGVSIIFVLISHCMLGRINRDFLLVYYIDQVMPVFMILMSITGSLFFKKNKFIKLSELYSKSYFKNKFNRIIIPYLIIYLIALIIRFTIFSNDTNDNIRLYKGYLLISGAGNYFIILLIQFILIFPFIYYCYQKKKKLTIIICFIINFIFQFSFYFNCIITHDIFICYTHREIILRFMSNLVLGLIISNEFKEKELINFLMKNKFIIIGFVISCFYLIIYYISNGNINKYFFLNLPTFYNQNIFSVFFTVLIILLVIRFLPNNSMNTIHKFFKHIGKASYHIYLIQMIYFCIITRLTDLGRYTLLSKLVCLFTSLVFCIIIGILFYELDNYVKLKFIHKK